MKGPILALDLATNMGWCEGISGEAPKYGSVRLAQPGGTNPEAYETLYNFLSDRFTLTRYQMVIFEAPLPPSHMAGKTNANTNMRLTGLCEVLEWICYRHSYFGNRIKKAAVHDVRKHLLGFRPQKGDAKKEVMERLRALGFSPPNHDAADALAIWLYATALTDKQAAQMTSPLFAPGKE